jgi:hypothetical protein
VQTTAPPPAPVQPQPQPQPPPPAGTTQTTAAEYNEQAGAEREEKKTEPNVPMLAAGGALFAGPYIAGVIVAAQSDLHEDKHLYVPVVGPWVDLGTRPCTFQSSCSNGDHWASAALIASGVSQGVGVVLAAASFFVPETQTSSNTQAATKPSMHVMPVSYAGGGGVGASGTF